MVSGYEVIIMVCGVGGVDVMMVSGCDGGDGNGGYNTGDDSDNGSFVDSC